MAEMQPRHVVIVALRRSGTTALWHLLRQDARWTCYDEPFSHLLTDLPAENKKRTRAEFIALFERDPAAFRTHYAPIPRGEEVTRGLTDEQARYLEFLMCDGPTVFDATRCMGKIPAIHEIAPDAALLHLFRHPIAFATSHLLPSDRLNPLGIRDKWNRLTALTRRGHFNGWGMEELTRGEWSDECRSLFAEVGVKLPPRNAGAPAAQRLLAIWLAAYRLAEGEGRSLYGKRFMSLSFEELCAAPSAALERIYALVGAEPQQLDTSRLRAAKPGYRSDDRRWLDYAKAVGFSEAEIERFFPKRSAA